MPVPTSINDLSTTAASNSPSGSDSPATLDDHIRAIASFIASLRDGKADSADAVLLTGNQTVAGTKTFSSPISGSITGNAATATTATNSTQLGGVAASGYQTALGFTPVQQGGGSGMGTNKIYVGWGTSGEGLRLVVDSTDFANTWPVTPENSRLMGQIATNTYGSIGVYMLLRRNASSSLDDLVSGSELFAAGFARASDGVATVQSSGAMSGTWRCLSYAPSSGSLGAVGLYIRVS